MTPPSILPSSHCFASGARGLRSTARRRAMAEVEKSKNLDEVLKPFYKRASEAEDRLAKLEALLAKKGDSDIENKEVSSIVKDFQSNLETAQAELMSEREKASEEIQKLAAENLKLQYRITHLVRALKEADAKLATK